MDAKDSMHKSYQDTLDKLAQELASAKKEAEEQRAIVVALMAARDRVSDSEREQA